MKKIIKILIIIALTLLLTACSQETQDAAREAALDPTTDTAPADEGPTIIIESEPEPAIPEPDQPSTNEPDPIIEDPVIITVAESTLTEPETTTVTIESEIEITVNEESEIIDTPEIQIVIDTTGDIIVEIIEPDPAPPFLPKFVIKIGTDPTADYFLSDGITTEPWLSGQVRRAGPRLYSHGTELTQYDVSADPSSAVELLIVPTHALAINSDIYYCREFTPAESFAQGGRAVIHTEIYKNDSMISFFAFNQWGCADIVSVSNNVWIIDINGGYHPVESSPSGILQVIPNRFFIHSRDTIEKTVMISDVVNDEFATYETNWTFYGSQWNRSADGVEYSESGTIWSPETGLIELSTAMSDFNEWPYPIIPEAIYGESPVFLAVGELDGLLYWIETNSGWLFVYDPLSDGLIQSWRLYAGDGTHASGISKRASLHPWLDVDSGQLYYSEPGAISVLDIDSGFISIIYGGDGVVLPF